MPETEERKSKPSPFTVNGREIPLRWIITILAFLGLGGGGTSLFMSEKNVDTRIEEKAKPIKKKIREYKEEDDSRHIKIDHTFKRIEGKIDRVQNVQYKQFARSEAVRVTDKAKIKFQADREAAQFRLYDMNLNRLQSGREPCQNIDCTN